MATNGTSNSKLTGVEHLFIDRLPARRLIDFRTHVYTPSFLMSNASRFLDHEWIDLLALEAFLEKAATGDLNASTRTDLSPADRRLLDTLSVREDSYANTAFDFGRPDLTPACNNPDVSGLDGQQFPRTLPFNPSFDDFNFVSPPVMAADPFQDLINAYGIYSTPFDDSFWLSSTPSSEEYSSSPFSFPTAHPGNEEQPSLSIATPVDVDSWPVLTPPQPDSPPSLPMIDLDVSSAPTATKARSHREPEVDVRSILPETLARSRAPMARKRNAEEAIEVHKSKKAKKMFCQSMPVGL
ncbi:hypothetical protein B0H13DRAFT_2570993 [Mycena leptocephala]|nr:hypothetical protein B0H13DRAFT_2570993 [Mycena leptocephala]